MANPWLHNPDDPEGSQYLATLGLKDAWIYVGGATFSGVLSLLVVPTLSIKVVVALSGITALIIGLRRWFSLDSIIRSHVGLMGRLWLGLGAFTAGALCLGTMALTAVTLLAST